MKVLINYKEETRLDDEEFENVKNINIYDQEIDFIYNNSITQCEKGIEIMKTVPRELINSYWVCEI